MPALISTAFVVVCVVHAVAMAVKVDFAIDNGTNSTQVLIGHCTENPQSPGSYVMINALVPCGLTVVETHYHNPNQGPCSGDISQVGHPSGFCSASTQTSQKLTCHGVDAEGDLK